MHSITPRALARITATIAAAFAAITATMLVVAAVASASPPSCTSAQNYLALTTFNIATWVGADTGLKLESWYPDSCLQDPATSSAHVVLHHVGANFGGYGNPETVRVEANVYSGIFSDEGCNNGQPRSLNDGYVDTLHNHFGGSGSHRNDNIPTPC